MLGAVCFNLLKFSQTNLGTLATDSARQLDVLRHDGDALGVNRAQVGVFEQTDQVGLGGFLKDKLLFHIKV